MTGPANAVYVKRTLFYGPTPHPCNDPEHTFAAIGQSVVTVCPSCDYDRDAPGLDALAPCWSPMTGQWTLDCQWCGDPHPCDC